MKYSLFAGAAAALVSMVNAYTQPTGALGGNPIYLPNTQAPVTAGKPYTVTWDPTTEGTVTLLLLKGPPENAIPQYPIAEAIANSGTYTWTPETSLEGAETGYGIQLIVDATGDYQYTTQFGVKNDAPVDAAPAPSAAPSVAPAEPVVPGYGEASSAAPVAPGYTVSYATEYETKTDCDCSETPVPTAPSVVVPEVPGVAYPTGHPNVPQPPVVPAQPEYPMWNQTTPEVPNYPTATGVPQNPVVTGIPPQQYTGAAGQIKAGGIMMAVVAIAAVAMF